MFSWENNLKVHIFVHLVAFEVIMQPRLCFVVDYEFVLYFGLDLNA